MRADMTQAERAFTSCRCQQLLFLVAAATGAAVDAAVRAASGGMVVMMPDPCEGLHGACRVGGLSSASAEITDR